MAILATASTGPGVSNSSLASSGTALCSVTVIVLADAEALGDGGDVGAVGGEAALAAGLAELLVVEHEDAEIRGRLVADHAERADAHQQLAVAGDAHDAAPGLREGNPSAVGTARPMPPQE